MKKLLTTLLLLTILLTTVTPAFALASQTTPSGLSFEEMGRQIDALMSEHVGTSTPGAAIVVVHEGEIIFTRGYGYADIENQIPVDPAVTVFEHASISKTFVWVAVMQLVEQGRLDLDADITTYLPESFVFEKPFTMRDLLNHTAGFADVALNASFDGERLPTLEEVLLVTQPIQTFSPGAVSAYSNWGSALAGLVVAEVSGQDFVAYEQENILRPANMQHTLNLPDWLGNQSFLANRAQGYVADGDGGFREETPVYILQYPSGALNGTAEDLALFIKALTPPTGESGPLFAHAETLQTLFSSSSPDPVNRPGMQHGFFPYDGVLSGVGHGGNLPGFSTDFAFAPEARFGYVLLTNATGEMELLPAMAELLLGSLPEVPMADMPSTTAAVEGRFVTARRFDGTFLEFAAYAGLVGLPIITIRAIDEYRIALPIEVMDFGTVIYIQTAPYVFRVYDASEAPMIGNFVPELRFLMEDGVPVQILVPGMDFTALPTGRTMPFLIGSLVSVALSVIFFLIAPIVLFIVFLVRRKKQKPRTLFDRVSTGFLLSGTLLMLNNLVLVGLFGINPIRTAAEVAPFIWINYVLAGLVALLFVGSIWSWRTAGEARGKRKVLFVITAVVTAMFIILLWHWNFFVLL